MSEQEKNTEQGVHKRRTRYKGKYQIGRAHV